MRNIVGHKRQQEELLGNIRSGNIAHAYLLSGPRHLGKFTLAREIALHLITHGLSPSDAKQERERCATLTHRDFLVLDDLWTSENDVLPKTSNISQEERMKLKLKTDAISIHDVRSIQHHVSSTKIAPYRCCLIRSIERMQVGAANAFLKLLEEPPEGTIFFLTTESESSVLPTIISRTRIVRFHPVPNSVLMPLLQGVSEDDAVLILHLANGAPGKVLSLAENPEELRRVKQLHTQATEFWRTENPALRLAWLNTGLESEEISLDELLLHLHITLREHREHIGPYAAPALTSLATQLKTNAHRGLLMEQFVLALMEKPC